MCMGVPIHLKNEKTNTEDSDAEPKCTCEETRKLREMTAELEGMKLRMCPTLTLPTIGIDFFKSEETVVGYKEAFDKGVRIVFKDLGRFMPTEISKSIEVIKRAEFLLNCSHTFTNKSKSESSDANNNEVTTDSDQTSSSRRRTLSSTETDEIQESTELETNTTRTTTPRKSTPSSRESGDSITDEFTFNHKIALIFKFHGKKCSVGRLWKNCPITLEKSKLVVITMDDRYEYCSRKEIIFITNLNYYKRYLTPGAHINIGENVVIMVLKTINKHITCCVQKGGQIKSYFPVEFNLCLDLHPQMHCLTTIDKENCLLALKHDVDAIVLPNVYNSCYIIQVGKYLETCCPKSRIKILIEFDFDMYDNQSCCQKENLCDIIDLCDGVYVRETFPNENEEELLRKAVLHNKIIIWTHIPEISCSWYYGSNIVLPTCYLIVRNRRQTPKYAFKEQYVGLTNMINQLHRQVINECGCKTEPNCTKTFISITNNGSQTIDLSNVRNQFPIIAITDDQKTARILHLYKGVKPLFYDWTKFRCKPMNSIVKYLLRLAVAYSRQLCLLDDGFCIKRYCFESTPCTCHLKSDSDSSSNKEQLTEECIMSTYSTESDCKQVWFDRKKSNSSSDSCGFLKKNLLRCSNDFPDLENPDWCKL